MIKIKKGNYYVDGDKLLAVEMLPEHERRGIFAGNRYYATVEIDGKRSAAKLRWRYRSRRETVVAFAKTRGLILSWGNLKPAQVSYVRPGYQHRL